MDSIPQTSTKGYFDLYFSLSTYQLIIGNLIYLVFVISNVKHSLNIYIAEGRICMDLKTIQCFSYSLQISTMPISCTS